MQCYPHLLHDHKVKVTNLEFCYIKVLCQKFKTSFLPNPMTDLIFILTDDRYLPKSLGSGTPSSARGLKVKVSD